MTEHIDGVLAHKQCVGQLLTAVASDLIQRAILHDFSKFSSDELDAFERMTPILKTLIYGTQEYKNALSELGPALTHHYQENDHHPEHFEAGIGDMNLLQLVEMVCDWMAATQRVQNGNIFTSLEVNKARFGISDQLYQILRNTVIYLQQRSE